MRIMTRSVLILGLVLGVSACVSRPQLYSWGPYPRMQYESLQNQGASASQQITTMEAHMEKTKASASLPPGFRAHLGMLYLSEGKVGLAADMWNAEKSAFPESAPYMDRLLARLDGKSGTTKKNTAKKGS